MGRQFIHEYAVKAACQLFRRNKRNSMNKDIFEGKWKEMRGQLKEWWGELTDDELEQANGNAEQIVGLLQQKYGYTRERAEEEFNKRIEDVKEAVEKV